MVSIEEAFAQAQRELLGREGIVGVSYSGNTIIIYVERQEISVPASVLGYRVIKKVSGRIELL